MDYIVESSSMTDFEKLHLFLLMTSILYLIQPQKQGFELYFTFFIFFYLLMTSDHAVFFADNDEIYIF